MNTEDQNTQQPNPSEPEPQIEDLTLEESPDEAGEKIKGGGKDAAYMTLK